MKAIDLIKDALKRSDEFAMALIEDMRSAPLTSPTPRGGNHPLWVIGHLAWCEGAFHEMILGEANPLAHWETLFAARTEPTTNARDYPSYDELVAQHRKLRARNLELLNTLGDAGLDRPNKAPSAGTEDFFPTIGSTLLFMALHQMIHAGQVADARRAAGRKPMFFPPDRAERVSDHP
jgi:hypothetical protein